MKRAAALAFSLLAAGCGGGGSSVPSANVVLEATNGSGVDGTAALTQASSASTEIAIETELDVPATAEIVGGDCAGFAPPTIIRKLGALTGGHGEFTVPLDFSEITGTGYTIAIKRGREYVACGSIVA